jgi:SPP1 gp7 family putative phage head morphogenesis protein
LRRLPGLTHSQLESDLSDLYHHGDCQHDHDLEDLADGTEEMLVQIVMKIWQEKQMPSKIDPALTKYFASKLMDGVEKGYGESLASVDYDTPDFVMLRKMKDSVFHFSAAKNYQQLKALSQALIHTEGKNAGKLKTFSEFKDAAYQINQDHVKRWLKAEYEMTVATGQMAATWTRFQENAKELPLLKFDAVNDDRTTPVCHSLDGVVRPIDDSFWSIYYPPNHWGCRSDVQQLSHGQVTPSEKIITPEKMPEMFKTNLAQKGLAFPPNHPYFKDAPESVKEQAKEVEGFQPALSIKEASARIKALGVDNVFLGNAHLSHYNATLEALEKIPARGKPDFIGNGAELAKASGRAVGRKASEWYGASMASPEMFINGKSHFVDEGMYQLVGINTRQYKTTADITAQKTKIQELYVRKFGRKYFYNTDGRLTHFHEFGHVADNAKGNHSSSQAWQELSRKWHEEEKYDTLKSPSEAFAEAFADLYGNDGKRIPDYIKDHLTKLFK